MMSDVLVSRRGIFRAAAAALALDATGLIGQPAWAQQPQQVRWSAGREPAKTQAPANATDCHFHIYDSNLPIAPYASLKPPDASVDDYLGLRRRLGLTRGVVVLPSTYGTDNRDFLPFLTKLGKENTRMVGVVDTSVTDQELRQLHDAGMRAIRFNLSPAGATTLEMLEPLSRRVSELGWHCQIHMDADKIVEAQDLFLRIPGKLVFDHMAHVPQPQGVSSPVFALMRRLLDKGNSWVKLSGAYIDTQVGPPTYADSGAVVKAFLQAAPERMVWGSDWPHPGKPADQKPDDAQLFDLLTEWIGDASARHRVLVENPADLYDFPRG